ncbi:MAG: hypothetical protein JW829_09590 [Pirellulales bacterium]|nr:hypothetical protein [Pirellulales bacterium]
MAHGRIITVGLTPAWDVRCQVDGLDWGDHQVVRAYTRVPAGKALNISKALAFLEHPSIATGLWGAQDYPSMCEQLKSYGPHLDVQMLAVPGNTRTNITVEDIRDTRHFHLRFPEELCSETSIGGLVSRLDQLVRTGDLCVFAGSMPHGRLMDHVLDAMARCANKNACVILDTSGKNYPAVLSRIPIRLISPNLAELEELLGTDVEDEPESIVRASRGLLRQVDIILLSRGKHGAMIMQDTLAFSCSIEDRSQTASTEVGCGDYLLAGFLAGMDDFPESAASDRPAPSSLRTALERGVRLATAHAWGLTKTETWAALEQRVATRTDRIS